MNQRNGYRPRQWDTRAGTIGPNATKLRKGSRLWTLLEPRRTTEKALMAVIVAVAVNTDGRREVLGLTVVPSEAETFWSDFLRSLIRTARIASSSRWPIQESPSADLAIRDKGHGSEQAEQTPRPGLLQATARETVDPGI